jgi:hypothetical protein
MMDTVLAFFLSTTAHKNRDSVNASILQNVGDGLGQIAHHLKEHMCMLPQLTTLHMEQLHDSSIKIKDRESFMFFGTNKMAINDVSIQNAIQGAAANYHD